MNRVLYILSSYPCRTETFITREIRAIRQPGIEVQIFALRKGCAIKVDKNDNIVYRAKINFFNCLKCLVIRRRFLFIGFKYIGTYLARPFYLLKLLRNSFYLFWLAEYCYEKEIDLIHAHFADMPTDLALQLSQITNIPFTFSAHARDVFCSPRNLKMKCREASAVFACSFVLAKLLKKWGQDSKIHLVYHGLDFTDFRFTEIYDWRIRRFSRLYSEEKEFNILAIGRLVSKKGFSQLIQALALLNLKNISCTIIGSGPLEKNLLNLIYKLNLEKHIRLTGEISFAEICEEFRKSHLLVVPSIVCKDGDSDNIPNVILEAQAFGVPVLASDLPAIREVIQPNISGFLVETGNIHILAEQIFNLIQERKTVLSVLVNARKQVEDRFDVSKNVKQIVGVWKKCLNNNVDNFA